MKKTNGFAAIETILFIVIFGIIGFTGWYVLQAKSNIDKSLNSNHSTTPIIKKSSSSKNATKTAAATLETYKNTDYGFSFQYPSTWTISENLQDGGRGEPEGNIVVTSPSGTAVTFNANLGGKGGDCGDDQANGQETARTCMTFDYLKLEPFASGIPSRTFYLYQAKVTPPTNVGGSPLYQIGIVDNEYGTPSLGSHLTDVNIDLISPAKGDVQISYASKDGSANTTPTFLDSNVAQQVASVLKTFQIIK